LEGAKAARHAKEMGYGKRAELARKFEKTKEWLYQHERLLKLPPEVLRRLSSSEITKSKLIEISRLPSYEQQEAVFEVARDLPHKEIRKVVSLMKEKGVSAEEAANQVLAEKERKTQEKLEEEAQKQLKEGQPNPFSVKEFAQRYAEALQKFERKINVEQEREDWKLMVIDILNRHLILCPKCHSKNVKLICGECEYDFNQRA
jgi:hypothetical protein